MSRSRYKRATVLAENDAFISLILTDSNFKITEDGRLLTRYGRNGKLLQLETGWYYR